MRRFVEWHIEGRENDYLVFRYENGHTIQVDVVDTREQAACAYELDRAKVLADPLAVESRSVEYKRT